MAERGRGEGWRVKASSLKNIKILSGPTIHPLHTISSTSKRLVGQGLKRTILPWGQTVCLQVPTDPFSAGQDPEDSSTLLLAPQSGALMEGCKKRPFLKTNSRLAFPIPNPLLHLYRVSHLTGQQDQSNEAPCRFERSKQLS